MQCGLNNSLQPKRLSFQLMCLNVSLMQSDSQLPSFNTERLRKLLLSLYLILLSPVRDGHSPDAAWAHQTEQLSSLSEKKKKNQDSIRAD